MVLLVEDVYAGDETQAENVGHEGDQVGDQLEDKLGWGWTPVV